MVFGRLMQYEHGMELGETCENENDIYGVIQGTARMTARLVAECHGLMPLRNGSTDAALHLQVPIPFGTPKLSPKVLFSGISAHFNDVNTTPNAQQ